MSNESEGLTELRVETVSLGGILDSANDAMAICLRHCKDYPNLTKSRKVKVEIQITPVKNKATGDIDVEVKHFAVAETPKLWGNDDYATIRNGKFVVNSSPHTANLEANQIHLSEYAATKAD